MSTDKKARAEDADVEGMVVSQPDPMVGGGMPPQQPYGQSVMQGQPEMGVGMAVGGAMPAQPIQVVYVQQPLQPGQQMQMVPGPIVSADQLGGAGLMQPGQHQMMQQMPGMQQQMMPGMQQQMMPGMQQQMMPMQQQPVSAQMQHKMMLVQQTGMLQMQQQAMQMQQPGMPPMQQQMMQMQPGGQLVDAPKPLKSQEEAQDFTTQATEIEAALNSVTPSKKDLSSGTTAEGDENKVSKCFSITSVITWILNLVFLCIGINRFSLAKDKSLPSQYESYLENGADLTDAERQLIRVYKGQVEGYTAPLMTDIEVISPDADCGDIGKETIFKATWPGSKGENLPPVVVPGIRDVQICASFGPSMLEGKKKCTESGNQYRCYQVASFPYCVDKLDYPNKCPITDLEVRSTEPKFPQSLFYGNIGEEKGAKGSGQNWVTRKYKNLEPWVNFTKTQTQKFGPIVDTRVASYQPCLDPQQVKLDLNQEEQKKTSVESQCTRYQWENYSCKPCELKLMSPRRRKQSLDGKSMAQDEYFYHSWTTKLSESQIFDEMFLDLYLSRIYALDNYKNFWPFWRHSTPFDDDAPYCNVEKFMSAIATLDIGDITDQTNMLLVPIIFVIVALVLHVVTSCILSRHQKQSSLKIPFILLVTMLLLSVIIFALDIKSLQTFAEQRDAADEVYTGNHCLQNTENILSGANNYHRGMLTYQCDLGSESARFLLLSGVIIITQIVISMVQIGKCKNFKKV